MSKSFSNEELVSQLNLWFKVFGDQINKIKEPEDFSKLVESLPSNATLGISYNSNYMITSYEGVFLLLLCLELNYKFKLIFNYSKLKFDLMIQALGTHTLLWRVGIYVGDVDKRTNSAIAGVSDYGMKPDEVFTREWALTTLSGGEYPKALDAVPFELRH